MGIGRKAEFKSNSVEQSTPLNLFTPLKVEFNIKLDVCASKNNYKCERYFTKEDNALLKEWNGVCWMNPPFSRDLKKWVEKAYNASLKGNIIVCLLPVRSNTKWWHKFVMKAELRFICGELKFDGHKRGLWLPMCVVIFGSKKVGLGESIFVNNPPERCSEQKGDGFSAGAKGGVDYLINGDNMQNKHGIGSGHYDCVECFTVKDINEHCEMGGCDENKICKKDGLDCKPYNFNSWEGLCCRHMT